MNLFPYDDRNYIGPSAFKKTLLGGYQKAFEKSYIVRDLQAQGR